MNKSTFTLYNSDVIFLIKQLEEKLLQEQKKKVAPKNLVQQQNKVEHLRKIFNIFLNEWRSKPIEL